MLIMARDYQIDETEEALLLHVPPPNIVWKVAVAAIIGASSLMFGVYCFYLWLARSESTWAFVFCAAYNAFIVALIMSLRILYGQLAKKEVVFERHVIGIDYRILGMRVQRRWFSAYQVQEWVTVPNRDGMKLLLALRYRDRIVRVAESLDQELWLSLVVRMQRKDFVYV